MKFLLLAALAAALTSCAHEAVSTSAVAAGPRLQLVVRTPPQSDMLRAENTSDSFAQIADEAFRGRGYRGGINPLYDTQPTEPGAPVLTINLIRWRMGPTRMPECDFDATLNVNGREQRLGHFSQSDLALDRGFGRGDDLRRVAESALRDLAAKLANEQLLPGFPPPKRK